ncbi:Asp-tRNA(Asn)/Glu-tRNA(Gln) amidotransferase subunit GatA [Campylobacter lari]|uniref:Asp-tRNA(Asn)/Glu-tRNA(Gln) amidotransferase subunit GatA n=1 Tax=Campylobacter lari TaxID=201 RepID=UPI0012C3C0A3|nr:Asp-tRNA(Asn)/Glu-tRNA(Gln) amidotransferase subunit GatA [Campylobacter lari]EAM0941087.1 Asp-tRNA(Asn)/Glu-tRNA(Gln) amidotransferase subunit GatA [Campylobacter lari]EGK8061259.1 Asp-tRNA(Asn)/Glu-tRNA(Gln) amidotransferase subunit GatA [Campylobacter lari]EGO9779929.1 Asp-tRNA(Asn)/Glu-tRNA(Gln) amidotransferase subunit GatA [Campylobacter lari]EJN1896337.1 Asp-tRNA(Asn)/Glu-tRNA(Gln) amidotransferase subunit GatA [Campylobacter lari]EJS0897364.1 Asp-tRNA(Asn)/Glu-tRNA(Gln) amidotransfe
MVTLEEALKFSKEEIINLKKELNQKAKEQKHLGAYVEQFLDKDLSESGDGVPVAIKDNISVKDWELTCASKILQGYVAPYDASVIANLRKNNLSPFGRCNMDEFAMGSTSATSFYGKTLNPHDNTKVPGGSSGGSAVAVASGLAIASLGSDTGGSVRQPAAFCGCVGFKPSYGRVSRYGLAAYSSSLDQIGVLTQNVKDAAILYDVIAGYDEKDSTSANIAFEPTTPKLNANKKLKIAVIKNYIDQTNDDVKQALLKTIDMLKANGHEIVYKDLMDSTFDVAAYYIIAAAEASANLSRYDGVRYGRRSEKCDNLSQMYINSRSEGFGEEVKRRILLGTFVLSSGYYDAYYIKAQKARRFIKQKYEEILNDCDLIFMPVAPSVAFGFNDVKTPIQMYLEDVFTISVNLAGLGGISVPVGKNENGLNISAQFICKAYDEQTLLDGALSLEEIIKNK